MPSDGGLEDALRATSRERDESAQNHKMRFEVECEQRQRVLDAGRAFAERAKAHGIPLDEFHVPGEVQRRETRTLLRGAKTETVRLPPKTHRVWVVNRPSTSSDWYGSTNHPGMFVDEHGGISTGMTPGPPLTQYEPRPQVPGLSTSPDDVERARQEATRRADEMIKLLAEFLHEHASR